MTKRQLLAGVPRHQLLAAAETAPMLDIDARGCLGKADLDEPVFVLVAHDRIASGAVRDWGHRARGLGVRQEKVNGAMEDALAMDVWQFAHPGQVKDPD